MGTRHRDVSLSLARGKNDGHTRFRRTSCAYTNKEEFERANHTVKVLKTKGPGRVP